MASNQTSKAKVSTQNDSNDDCAATNFAKDSSNDANYSGSTLSSPSTPAWSVSSSQAAINYNDDNDAAKNFTAKEYETKNAENYDSN